MKFTDNLISKYGADKLLHFAIFGIIVSYANNVSLLYGGIAFIIMTIISLIKELVLDDFFNVKDLLFGICGGILSMIIKLIIDLWLK